MRGEVIRSYSYPCDLEGRHVTFRDSRPSFPTQLHSNYGNNWGKEPLNSLFKSRYMCKYRKYQYEQILGSKGPKLLTDRYTQRNLAKNWLSIERFIVRSYWTYAVMQAQQVLAPWWFRIPWPWKWSTSNQGLWVALIVGIQYRWLYRQKWLPEDIQI